MLRLTCFSPFTKSVNRALCACLAAAGLALLAPVTHLDAQTPLPHAVRARIAPVHARSLQFEVNEGQSAPPVKYLARGANSVVFLTADGAVIETAASQCDETPCRDRHLANQRGVLQVQFAGAAAAAITASQPQSAHINEYVAGRRLTDVPSFGAVEYRGLYPGIDLRFYGRDGVMEYDYDLAGGADASRIALQFAGMEPRLTPQGDLAFALAGGPVAMRRPLAYQEINGRRVAVRASFQRRSDGTYGFALGSYDHSRALVIDPILNFATFLGGTTLSEANAVAAGCVSNVCTAFVTGETLDTNFPLVDAEQTTNTSGTFDAFVTEFSSTGTSLVYSTYIGGSTAATIGSGIAVDSSDNAYITGNTLDSTFPTTPGAYSSSQGGGYDAFVTKLTSTGALSYSTFLGGSEDDKGTAIAVTSTGDAVVAGSTASSNFPTTTGAAQTSLAGATNAFITELNPTADTPLVWSTYLGGDTVDVATAVALDGSANAYVAGYTDSPNFPVSAAPVQSKLGGGYDAFIAEVDRSGKKFDYATFLGGTENDEAYGIAVDIAGDAYVTGFTNSINFPVTDNAYDPNSNGGTDVFVAEIPFGGTGLAYSTYAGGSGSNVGTGIVVDAAGDAYVTGYTDSEDFPVTANAVQSTFGGNEDAFLFKLSPIGSELLYCTYFGGTGIDEANGIAIDPNGDGDIYFAGFTKSSNFPVTTGAYNTTLPSTTAAFAVKMIAAAQAVFNPAQLGFAAQAVNVASAEETVTLTNGGELTLDIKNVATTGPFTQNNDCPAQLPEEASCTINITFTPTTTGSASGSLVITDNSPTGSESMLLSGTGGDFTFSVAPTSNTITAGSSASYTLTVTPAAGYTDIINFTCSGTPAGATCTPSPTSLTMNGSSASLTTYTITTNAETTRLPPFGGGRWPWIFLLLAFASLLWYVAARIWRVRSGAQPLWRAPFWGAALLLASLGLAAAGCGGSASTTIGTPAGNYTLTFTGTDAVTSTITQSTTVLMTVD